MNNAGPRALYMRKWHKNNPDKAAEYNATYAAKNPERRRELNRAKSARYRAAHPDRVKAASSRQTKIQKRSRQDWQLRRKFGISLEQRDELLAAQGNRCGGCKREDPGWKGDWHVDHCHSTGAIRGILCHGCNTALGNTKDSPSTLRNLASYVEQYSSFDVWGDHQ